MKSNVYYTLQTVCLYLGWFSLGLQIGLNNVVFALFVLLFMFLNIIFGILGIKELKRDFQEFQNSLHKIQNKVKGGNIQKK